MTDKLYMSENQASDEMTMWYDDTLWLPFIEDDDANITGPGHQSREAFAKAVQEYDRVAAEIDSSDFIYPEVVAHKWVTVLVEPSGDWWATTVDSDHDNAIPVTTIWNVR